MSNKDPSIYLIYFYQNNQIKQFESLSLSYPTLISRVGSKHIRLFCEGSLIAHFVPL